MLLYLHIPFCDSKCFYCSFNSYVDLYHLKKIYMEALNTQITEEIKKLENGKLKSIFIGGGTPSCVEAQYYTKIFDTLKPYIDSDTEITSEANPNSASLKWLTQMKEHGVNRISFGVQTFDDEKLKFLGRNHNNKQAIKAINAASQAGYNHISCDIIYDTSKDTKELIDKDLAIIKTLPIDHISAYALIIEEGTKFFKNPSVQVENEDMARYIFKQFKQLGFTQYEISNFAKSENSRSKHNFGYWEKIDYLGVGAGAVGTYKNQRLYPVKEVQEYINNPLKYEEVEELTQDDHKFETIFLGLRSEVGVALDIFNKHELNNIKILIDENKIYLKDNRIFNYDFLITDAIVLFISP